jgi:hypothetical protein
VSKEAKVSSTDELALRQLKKKALHTAHRFIDYDSYGQKESRALAALKKKCPGWGDEEYRFWLIKAIALHQSAVEYIKTHAEYLVASYSQKPDQFDMKTLAADFIRQQTDFDPDEVVATLMWVFYWYQLR